MRTPEEVDCVLEMNATGLNASEITRATGIPRSTVRQWISGQVPDFEARVRGLAGRNTYACPVCTDEFSALPREEYVYLLGLYLGDGTVSSGPRGVFKLRIFCCDDYPQLMQECEDAMGAVLPTKVGRSKGSGMCTDVHSHSKHWPCLFPQAGPGMKHTRKIALTDWQQALVDVDPRPLIKGLIHSDGCRVLNRAVRRDGREYPPYPRYHFTNASADIREIFCQALDAIGVKWRQNNPRNISVAKRASVTILDEFIGPKR